MTCGKESSGSDVFVDQGTVYSWKKDATTTVANAQQSKSQNAVDATCVIVAQLVHGAEVASPRLTAFFMPAAVELVCLYAFLNVNLYGLCDSSTRGPVIKHVTL